MKLTAFPSTTPIYMFFFSMLGMLSVVTAVAIPNAGPAAVDGTGVTPGMRFRSYKLFIAREL